MKGATVIGALTFVSYCGGCAEAAIFPVSTDAGGCKLEQITAANADEDGNFQFHGPSRDGRWLVVGTYRGETQGAYVLDLQAGARRALQGINNAGALSEDASRVLVANSMPDRSTEIIEYALATGEQRAIAPHPKSDFLATYSPDGKWILFNSYRTGKSDIYVVPRAGGEPIRLTDYDGYDAHADFSPDMKRIAFHRNMDNDDYDIYQIDFATKAATPLITGPGEQAYPALSPDGRWIAFSGVSGDKPGKNDIFVAASDGARVNRLTHQPGYNAYPSWSAEGAFIYFNDERGGKRDVFRLAFDGNGGCRR